MPEALEQVVNGPSLTDWLQGVGTALAVALSLFSLLLEGLRRRRESQAAVRAQASRVLAWISVSLAGFQNGLGRSTHTSATVVATVQNLGNEPVWSCRLELLSRSGEVLAVSGVRELLLPDATWEATFRDLRLMPPVSAAETQTAKHMPTHVRVYFTDIEDRRWCRERSQFARF